MFLSISMWNPHAQEFSFICKITKHWKQPRCPKEGEWLNKLWYIYIMEYSWATQRNQVLICIIGMDLKTITLNEQKRQRNIYCMIPFIWNPRKYKLIYSYRKQINVVALCGLRGRWKGQQRVIIKGHKESFAWLWICSLSWLLW